MQSKQRATSRMKNSDFKKWWFLMNLDLETRSGPPSQKIEEVDGKAAFGTGSGRLVIYCTKGTLLCTKARKESSALCSNVFQTGDIRTHVCPFPIR